jgi:hypothetical protein
MLIRASQPLIRAIRGTIEEIRAEGEEELGHGDAGRLDGPQDAIGCGDGICQDSLGGNLTAGIAIHVDAIQIEQTDDGCRPFEGQGRKGGRRTAQLHGL